MRDVEYRWAKTRHGDPLVIVESPLGNGQELEPKQLRALAATLLEIATQTEARGGALQRMPVKGEYAKHELYGLIDQLAEMERL